MRRTVYVVVCLFPSLAAAQLSVTQLSPAPNALAAATAPVVRFDFDRPLDPSTVTTDHFSAFGRWTGPVNGTLQLTNGNQSVLFHPDRDFTAGDLVTVGFSDGLRAVDSSEIQVGGYNYQFWTRTQRVATLPLNEIDTLSTGDPSRPYGGVATDLDNNGWLDITLVNEDSADLRVFMNREDGSGLFEDYAQPTYAVGNRASASEAA
ncbi:MAG: Ig-like domain-containing protein, partial [Planctomycetota bacterium]